MSSTTERSTMNISLPASLKHWVDEQAAQGDFGTASEYIRHLLRNERLRQLRERTDAALVAGLDSGAATEMTAADWASIRKAGRQQLAARKSGRGRPVVRGRRGSSG